MTEDKPQHDSQKILNFQHFSSLLILIKRIFIKKQCIYFENLTPLQTFLNYFNDSCQTEI